MTAVDVVFGALGLLSLGAGVLTVTSRNVVHAALWLVVSFGALAGCYLVLTAELVAWVQVLVYVGAIVVLLLFAAMLTRTPVGGPQDLDSPNKPAAVLVAVGTGATLTVLHLQAFGSAYVDLRHRAGEGSARAIGEAVFATAVLPFEVASLLLLAALVGAIVLSRRDVT